MPRALLKLPSRITRPGVEIRGAPLKVRSETQYLEAYLSLGAPYAPLSVYRRPVPFRAHRHRRLCYFHGPLFISELKARIIQAVLAAFAGSAHEISLVLNPKRRHIRLRNEKMLWFCADIFSQSTYLWLYVIFAIITVD